MREQLLRLMLIVLAVLCGLETGAQKIGNPVVRTLQELQTERSFVTLDALYEVDDPLLRFAQTAYISDQKYLYLDASIPSQVHRTRPLLLELSITTRAGDIVLQLFRKDIFADGYVLNTSDGPAVPRSDMSFYRGMIAGNANSVAAVSFIGDEVRIVFADDTGNHRIQKTENSRYILFRDTDLKLQESYECFVDDTLINPDAGKNTPSHDQRSSVGDCVEIYFECDLESYQDNNSSIADTEGWVAALFNEVSTLYDNENIPISISEIFVWTTSDPYMNLNTTSAVLNEFVDQTQQNGYNGRLAHLLSTRGLGGGIAYVDVLCSTNIPCAVSASLSTNIVPFPNYSWTVMVVAHELGHNFGSRHTHRCWWNGNNTQIDDCGNEWANNNGNTPEGAACYDENNPILPTGSGGTVMSYCHLISGVGINFNNGFGPQPGGVIYDEFINASCNTGNCGPPACTELLAPAPGSTGVDMTEDIAWGEVPGADGYIVNIGTTSGGGQVVNDLDVGDVTNYDPGNLPPDEQIFVLITPYNLGGNATGCSSQSFFTEAGGPPQCTQLTSPSNGSVDVGLDEDLFWNHSTGNQFGYKVNVGLTPGGGELVNDQDVGNVTTFDPGTYPVDEEIYVQISPYGPNGDVGGCPVESFTTVNNLSYCSSQGNITSDEWIGSFSFGAFTNASGASQYSDYTNLVIAAGIGETYTLTMTPEFSGQTWNEYFRVWIDFNKDGDFTDLGEEIFSEGPTTTTVSGTYTIPLTATTGNTRLRVSMKYNSFPAPCETFSYGEVEDYTIDIGCNVVTNALDSGPGSLRFAVDCADAGDTISFSDALDGQTITLLTNVINVAGNVSIVATPADNVTVQALQAQRVFEVGPNANALIEGLTLIAGTGTPGAALRNNGILMLKDMTLRHGPGTTGATLLLNTGQLSLEGNCTFEDP